MSRRIGMGGPVGLFHALIGFFAAVLVARAWEYIAREAHCSPTCPSFTNQALRLHHLYYGVGLVSISAGMLLFAKRQRVRWDEALFLGLGIGLFADEFGLVILSVPYTSELSVLVISIVAGALLLATIHAVFRDGTKEFQILDKRDALTVMSLLLGMGGVLYLDRALQPIVQALGIASAVSALVLLLVVGKTHFHRILVGAD